MSTETWIIIISATLTNLITLIGGLSHIATRLVKIETDIKWIKGNCPKCPQTWDQNSK